jgi:hypothetical protein
VWPENWAAVATFKTLVTQWRVGAGGPIGIDYGVVPFALRMAGVARSEWPEAFDGIQVMEDAALEFMRAQEAKRTQR